MAQFKTFLTYLACPECGEQFEPDEPQTFCHDCRSPLLAQYDLAAAAEVLTPERARLRLGRMWRWAEVLPVKDPRFQLTLGEGDTPLLELSRTGRTLGRPYLYMKDEAANPTGSFKARGLVMAVSKAAELGMTDLVMASAGNAGGALAAYAAQAGLNAHIYMPRSAPEINQIEVRITGAGLVLVDGLISDAAARAAEDAEENGWFSVSTFKEPYRVEGKKIMGYELAEDFSGVLPDAIIYPTGGGTGLVGMWKAFREMEEMGWIGSHRPRMISVQSAGCAPVVEAIAHDRPRMRPWENPRTIAPGIQVPIAFADRLILSAIRESGGTAVAVSDHEIMQAQHRLAEQEGLFAAPESAAALAGLKSLIQSNQIGPSDKVVVFNTASGLKYT
ncbi:MAG: threonine synthase [Candidatus Aminicenantaceae bacterium]